MGTIVINEKWYQQFTKKYGAEKAIAAGYFEETKPWTQTYTDFFGADYLTAPKEIPKMLQFSGAFFPFHEGHRDTLQNAINFLDAPVMVFIHVDHREYRHSKGQFNELAFNESFSLTKTLVSKHQLEIKMVFEDDIPDGCSRNFTRLYQELTALNPQADLWFLAGGDRASFCMTFIDEGRCLIAGRDDHEQYAQYLTLQNDRIIFLPGNNKISSTSIRKSHD